MFKVLFIEQLVYIAATIYRIEVAAFYASIVSVRIPASRTLVVTILIEQTTKTPCGYTDDASANNLPHYQPPPKIPHMKSSKSAKKESNKSHNFSSKDLRIHALRDPASLRIAEQSLELLHLM